MEDMILGDITDFIQHLNQEVVPKNKPIPIRTMFGIAVLRSLWNIVTGEECAIVSSRMHEISECFHW